MVMKSSFSSKQNEKSIFNPKNQLFLKIDHWDLFNFLLFDIIISSE